MFLFSDKYLAAADPHNPAPTTQISNTLFIISYVGDLKLEKQKQRKALVTVNLQTEMTTEYVHTFEIQQYSYKFSVWYVHIVIP